MRRAARQHERRGPDKSEYDLAPTAERILRAAKRILEKRGFSKLTWKSVSEEAGVNQSLISYYFGNTAGLLEAVVDSLFADSGINPERDAREGAEGSSTVHWLIDLQRHASSNQHLNRVQHELMPHALRRTRLRTRFLELYKLHRGFDADCLRAASPSLQAATLNSLAALTVAVVDGLAIQLAVDPKGFDHEGAYAIWESMLLDYLRRSGGDDVSVDTAAVVDTPAQDPAGESAHGSAAS